MIVDFNKDYYKKLILMNNYQEVNVSLIDFNLGNINSDILQLKWLCHENGQDFAKRLQLDNSIVTTGIGISGVPHIGTLGQIFNSIFLQQNGIKTQFVLGDLDAYNGKNLSLKYVQEIGNRYEAFIKKLGYDTHSKGILRNQFDATEVTRTMYLLAKFVDDEDFNNIEEDLHEFYSSKGKVDEIMSFRRKVSLLLMTADFIDLIISKKYTNIMVTLGIDEHKYVQFAEKVLSKLQNEGQILNDQSNINFSAIYTHIIKGFNNYPKMSKSFPDSSINIEMNSDDIYQRIMNENNTNNPEENTVYQMMCLVSNYSAEELSERYTSYLSDLDKWKKYKEEYTEYLISIFKLW